MKHLLIILLLALPTFEDINDDIANALKGGNAAELSKYFSESIELKIIDQEKIYSRVQAEQIVKDFFSKNSVKSFEYSHKSTPKNESSYAIGTLETAKGKFRVYILLKKAGTQFVIQQLRIEPGNE